ncbi:TPM domain-containing protein [Flagellimonas aequoris]|uniref:TPM domain-containing protein n=1 Tax=Flagellimonas aequoris TaxID=2306997 RepID=A0A418N7C0_9FLAO|nr:TPM domain-containing protein [Allomuricauda aequoris]RIV70653.1 TPM domain-containing protein [Allomuricauda aequoris]TXK02089.1 TPM domain-containing protein [Allomuricauda aequoris]
MGKTLVFCYLVLLSIFGFSQEKYPQLTQIVTDNAGIFTSGQLEGLRSKLTQFETETTNQLVILTINDLEGVTIEEYANGVFNQNKLGQAGKDNGILILFSKNDREVRIEVGYGLEPYITDAVASRIIRNTMIPKFKEEDYLGGLDGASDQLIELLKNPDALAEFNKEMEAENELPWWGYVLLMVFLSFFMVPGGFVFYKGYSSLIEMFRGIMIGKLGLFPGVFMIFAGLLQVFFGLIFIGVPLFFLATIMGITFDEEVLFGSVGWVIYGIIGFFLLTILLAILKIRIKGKEDFKLSWFKSDKTYMSKTFSSSGSHSFGSSSGGSSSSFSGGGGSSGGGGASGSW